MVKGRNRNLTLKAVEEHQRSALSEAETRFKDVPVPIGVPLFVRPGALSTVVLYAG